MNFHPLIVHFPIGLLVVYAALEVAWLFRWGRSNNLQFTKLLLLVFGTLGARASLQTGEIASHLSGLQGQYRQIMELHEWFAGASTNIFAWLLVAYIVLIFGPKMPHPLIQKLIRLVQTLQSRYLFVIAAALWVVCLMVTGALGGSLVYGIEADPITKLIVPRLLSF